MQRDVPIRKTRVCAHLHKSAVKSSMFVYLSCVFGDFSASQGNIMDIGGEHSVRINIAVIVHV